MRTSSELSPMTLFIPLLILGSFIRRKSKKAGAIYDLIWSIGILVWGMGVMDDGGTIVLFGSIELPSIAFIGIIALVIISEIISLISIIKRAPLEAEAEQKRIEAEAEKKRLEEEQEQQAIARIEDNAEKLAAPCTLFIVHRQGNIAFAKTAQLALNGRKLESLGNVGIVRTELDIVHNRLTVSCGAMARKDIEFDAHNAGAVRIDVQFKARKSIILLEENPNTDYHEPNPGEKRVRPVNIGMALWSITNFLFYLLGIVPLRKTLRAAKHPFDDIAQQRLSSAKKWNLWLSGILLTIFLIRFLSRTR